MKTMKKTDLILSFFFILYLFPVTSISQSLEKLEDVKIEGIDCINAKTIPERMVINTELDFYRYVSRNSLCSYNIPKIDYNERTLIGYKISTQGCDYPGITTNVFNDKDRLIIKVNIEQVGNCRKSYEFVRWINVPKVSEENVIVEYSSIF